MSVNDFLLRLRARLPFGRFGQNVAVLAGGTALGQGLVVLASPVLTRLYTPEDLGALTVYTSILAILLVVVSLRYEISIPLPDSDSVGASLLGVTLLAVFGMSALIAAGTLVFGGPLVDFVNAPALRGYLWLLPLGLVGAGTYQALSYWAVRKQAFGRIARTKLTQSIGLVFTQIGLGLLTLGPVGLLAGQVVGYTAGSGNLARSAWREDMAVLKTVTLGAMRRAASRYRRFPLLASGAALLNSGGVQLPPLLLAAFYGPQVAGWFGLGQRVIRMPMTLVGQSVAQVYLSEASRLAQEDPPGMRRLFLRTASRLCLTGSLPIVLLGLAGPWLFAFVFGGAWREAGLYVQVLAVMFAVQFAVVPLSQTLNVLERQDLQLAWDASRLVLVVAGLVAASQLGWTATTAILAYGIAMTVAYVILFFLSDAMIRQRLKQAGRHA